MQEQSRASQIALLSAGLIVVAVAAYWPSAAALWGYWTNPNFGGTHGLFVAPLSLWLLWRARDSLGAVAVRPSWVAGGLLLLGTAAWFVFWRAGIQTLHILIFPALMGLSVWAAFGYRAAACVAFPLAFLYFAVPAWGVLVGPLQSLTQWAVGVLAPLIGIPAQLKGDLVLLPGVGRFEIARGCSGANFMATGLAVALLLGEIERASLWRRASLLCIMVVLAVLTNWIRVLVIIDAGYTTHMQHVLVSQGHLLFGWVLFAIVMVAFAWFSARTSAPDSREVPVSRDPVPVGLKASAYVATLAALLAMPVAVYAFVIGLDVTAGQVSFQAPTARAPWRGPIQSHGRGWEPEFVGPHSQWSIAYEGPEAHRVDMVAIGYPLQGQGRELVNEQNSLFGATAFEAVAESKVALGSQPYIEVVAADDRNQRTLVWYVYDIGGRTFVTPLLSQLWYGVRSLGGPPYSVLFAFRAACDPSCDSARDTLRSFMKVMGADFFAAVSRRPGTT